MRKFIIGLALGLSLSAINTLAFDDEHYEEGVRYNRDLKLDQLDRQLRERNTRLPDRSYRSPC